MTGIPPPQEKQKKLSPKPFHPTVYDPDYGISNLESNRQKVMESYGGSSFQKVIARKVLSMESAIVEGGELRGQGHGRSSPEEAWWQRSLYYMAKPEEWSSKLVGKLFSNDSKYNFSSSSNYYDQVGFFENFRDAGLDPVTAGVLGLIAAIANPFDPWGKMRIFGLTKSGVLGKSISDASKVGGLKKVRVGFTKGSRAEDVGADTIKGMKGKRAEIFSLDGNAEEIAKLEKILKTPDIGANLKKSVTRDIKKLRKQRDNYTHLNRQLLKMQAGGASIDDLKLAETAYNRITKGQQHVLGWSSMLKADQLSLLGIHRGEMNRASRLNVTGFLPKKAQAVFGDALVKSKDALKGKGLKVAQSVAVRMGYPVIASEVAKAADLALRRIVAEFAGDQKELSDQVMNWAERVRKSGMDMNGEEMKAIVNGIERLPMDIKLNVKKGLDNFLEMRQKDPKKLEELLAKRVQNVAEDADLEAMGITPGNRVTPQQIAQQTPSGLTNKEATAAVALGNGIHSNTIVRALGEVDQASLKAAKGIQAVSKFKIVGDKVVARKLGAAAPMQVDEAGGAGNFHETHLEHLVGLLGDLARKKLVLTRLHPEDFLIQPHGGIQLINPEIIRGAESVDVAVKSAYVRIGNFLDNSTYLGRDPAAYEVLASAKALKKMGPTRAFRSNKQLQGADKTINIHQVLEEAPNMRRGRDMLERPDVDELEMDNFLKNPIGDTTIEREMATMSRELRNNRNPMTKPIEVQIHPETELLDVIEGQARLLAAKILGVDYLPVIVRKFANQKGKLNAGYYTGNSHRLSEFFELDQAPRGVSRARQTRPGQPAEQMSDPVVSQNYRLQDDKGKAVLLAGEDMQTATASAVEGAFHKVIGVGLAKDSKRARSNTARAYTTSQGIPTHEILIAEMAEKAENLEEFINAIRPILRKKGTKGRKGSMDLSNVTRHSAEANEHFVNTLKPLSTKYLDELAEDGFLSDYSLGLPRRVGLATSQGHTLVALDRSRNILTYTNTTKTIEEVEAFAKADMNRLANVADIDPSATVRLHASDDDALMKIRDFVDDAHPRLSDAYEGVPATLIDDARIAEWAEKKVFEITPEKLMEWGTSSGVLLGRARKFPDGTTYRSHRPLPFVIMRDGRIFASQRQTNVVDLAKQIYKEGTPYHVESGIVEAGRIVIQDVKGSLVESLSRVHLKGFEDRIHQLAKNFIKAGLSPTNELQIRMPFDADIWKRIYGDRVTLGDITKGKYTLKVPDELKGAVISTDLRSENRIFSIHNPRFEHENPLIRRLFQHIKNTNDELFVKEAMDSLNSTYWRGYFPRITTTEGRAALEFVNSLARNHMSQSKHLKTYENFMKERTFTDLTTPEVNQFFKMIETIRTDLKGKPELWVSEIIEKAAKEFKENLSKGGIRSQDLLVTEDQANRYLMISKQLGGAEIFHLQPIMALEQRAHASLKARKAVKMLDSIEETGAGQVVDVKGYERANEAKKGLEVHLKKHAKLVEEREALEASVRESEALGEIGQEAVITGTGKVSKMKEREAKALIKLHEAEKEVMEVHGSAAWDVAINKENVFISEADARRMVNSGEINMNDLPHGFENSDFVLVPLQKYKATFDKKGTKLLLMNEEAEAIARRYLGLKSGRDVPKFFKLWDQFHDYWRTWTLFPIPAYHMRNAISSVNMAWLGGVDEARDFKDSFDLLGILRRKRKGTITLEEANEQLQTLKFLKGNQVVNAQEMLQEFHKRGGIHGGFYHNEFSQFGTVSRRSDFERLMNKEGVKSITTAVDSFALDNAAIRAGYRTGQFIESEVRLAAFLNYTRKTGSFDEGERMMKAIFYDYSDLSVIERDLIRRFVPFYSWARHNTPRMVHTLLMDPIKHVRMARMVRAIQQGALDRKPPDEEGIPKYIKDNYGIVIHQNDDGTYLMKDMTGLFPVYDIFRALGSLSEGDVFGTVSDLGLTPFLKHPIEQILNYSILTGRKLEEIPGEPSKRPFSLGQLGFTKKSTAFGGLGPLNLIMNDAFIQDFFRLGSEMANVIDNIYDPSNWLDGDPSLYVGVGELLLGRMKHVDPEKTKAILGFMNNRMSGNFKRAIKKFEEIGQHDMADKLRNQMIDHMLQYGGASKK